MSAAVMRFKAKPVKRRDFAEDIRSNRRRSFILTSGIAALIALVSWGFGWYYGYQEYFLLGGLGIAAGAILLAWFHGGDIILSFAGAKKAEPGIDQRVINVVDEMRIAAGLPMPQVFIIDTIALNAFATGRDPEHAAVAVTQGLVEKLSREELQGVVAHELGHIRNFDVRYAMLVAILVGVVALLSDAFRSSVRWGGLRGRRGRGGKGNPVLGVIILLLIILAPICAVLLQMAISREREYMADASAAELTRNPLGLASALRKLASDDTPLASANRATQHLFIVNPLKSFSEKSTALMSTHPPTEERIKRLEAMVGEF